jgi:hypothetical protein
MRNSRFECQQGGKHCSGNLVKPRPLCCGVCSCRPALVTVVLLLWLPETPSSLLLLFLLLLLLLLSCAPAGLLL